MKVACGIKGLRRPPAGSVVTMGVFDGVHLGHARVIRDAVARARKRGLESIVVTFDPHPIRILRNNTYVPRLISFTHRIKLIEELGADMLLVIRFTKAFSMMAADLFVRQVLVDRLNAMEICASPKFYFGSGGKAGISELKELASPYGIRVNVIPPVKIGGTVVGSRLIRGLILKGELGKAAKCLGRPVSILGTIVAGSRLGRTLGYPTANINPHHEIVPPSGVYAVRIKVKGRLYKGVLNIGMRPTFYAPRDAEPSIEAHIFNFKGNIYGRDAEVYFVKKLRDEARYKGREALIAQIRKDEERARNILS